MNSVEGRIIKAISGFYYVETTDNTYECKARGSSFVRQAKLL